MDIELKRIPRTKDAPDEDCIWYLIVNGYQLGAWYGGTKRLYEDKYAWAKTQIKKRTLVIKRNIDRLEKELEDLKKELEVITN